MSHRSQILFRRHWWSIGGALIAAGALAWVLWRVDYAEFWQIVSTAEPAFLALLLAAIAAEQMVRAWKWRQLLYALRPVGTLRLFGTIMAGYFVNMIVPLGISPLVRSWLVARLEGLKTSAVLATAAIERTVDGVIFVGFVVLTLSLAAVPDPSGGIRLGLLVAALGSLLLFALILIALARFKRQVGRPNSWVERLAERLPKRFSAPTKRIAVSFAEGIIWPRNHWRGFAILCASVVIKLIAITYFLWAGLAFGIVLRPLDYLFLVVFLGFLIILTRFARIPGGFVFGAIFALDLLDVAEEAALAMVLAVQLATIVTIGGFGALALWRQGIALDDLRLFHAKRHEIA